MNNEPHITASSEHQGAPPHTPTEPQQTESQTQNPRERLHAPPSAAADSDPHPAAGKYAARRRAAIEPSVAQHEHQTSHEHEDDDYELTPGRLARGGPSASRLPSFTSSHHPTHTHSEDISGNVSASRHEAQHIPLRDDYDAISDDLNVSHENAPHDLKSGSARHGASTHHDATESHHYRRQRARGHRRRVHWFATMLDGLRNATPYGSHGLLDHSLTSPNVFVSRPISEDQREPAYQEELRVLFERRLRLVTTIAMMALPFFAIFHSWLSPKTAQMLVIHAALFTTCLATRLALPRFSQLRQIRLLSLICYALFCAGAGLVVSLMGRDQIFIMGGHNHLVLSVLLLPYSVWECAFIGLIAIGSLAWSGWFTLMPQQSHVYFSHLFVLCTTTLFVLYIAHFHNLTNRRAFDATFDVMRSATRLQTLSYLDSLTGGFNRRYLEKTMNTEIARATRFARPLSFMMFDLDNFKMVNDTRGHAAGDEVLREVWSAAIGAIREVDTAARYGGDEFCVVLPEADETAARTIAERLQEAAQTRLHNRFGNSSLEGRVTLSIGLVTMEPSESLTVQTLLERADERLYEAKRSGKNSIMA
jgi:diguanylate cyclase (GGDEF)-like protein